jgi:hypothetical protein
MINIDLASILNNVSSEWADPAARHNPTAPFICKPDPRAGLRDESLCTTVLAVSVRIIPPMTKRGPFVFLILCKSLHHGNRGGRGCYAFWQLSTGG